MQRLFNREFVSGLALCAFGVAALAIGARYDAGVATEMGAGYIPRLLAGGIVLLGLIVGAKSAFGGGTALPPLPLWPLICILSGIAAFGLLIPRGGLVVATFATVLAGKLASRELTWLAALFLAALLSGLSIVLFVQLLGIPMRVLPG